MTIYRWSAEGGVADTEVTVSNSGGASGHGMTATDKGTTGSLLYKASAAAHGSLGMEVIQGDTETCNGRWDFEDSTEVLMSVYVRFPTAPTLDYVWLQMRPTTGSFFAAHMRQTGSPANRLRFVQPGGATNTVANATPVDNTLLRVEMLTRLGATGVGDGVAKYAAYLGDSLTAITGTDFSLTNASTGLNPFNNLRIGRCSGAVDDDTHIRVDSLQIMTGVHAVDLGNPWPPDPPPVVAGGGVIRLREGGAWL